MYILVLRQLDAESDWGPFHARRQILGMSALPAAQRKPAQKDRGVVLGPWTRTA